jgi:hypothetical protein
MANKSWKLFDIGDFVEAINDGHQREFLKHDIGIIRSVDIYTPDFNGSVYDVYWPKYKANIAVWHREVQRVEKTELMSILYE